jgi:hypothetical protein
MLTGQVNEGLLCNLYAISAIMQQFIVVRSGAVGWGTELQAGRSWVRFTMVSLEYFIEGRTMALGLTQPLTEMSTRNISWG